MSQVNEGFLMAERKCEVCLCVRSASLTSDREGDRVRDELKTRANMIRIFFRWYNQLLIKLLGTCYMDAN